MIISVVMPTYHRVARFKDAVRQLFKTAPDVDLVVVIEHDDDESRQAILDLGAEGYLMRFAESRANNAIKAFNLGASMALGEAVMLGEDDIFFHPGWYENTQTLLHQGYGYIGCDNGNEHYCPTNYICTKEWLRKWNGGVLSPPCYESQPGDVEMWEKAKASGDFVWARDERNPLRVFVENLHPYLGKAQWDATYEKRKHEGAGDLAILQQRQAEGWPSTWEAVL